MPDLLNLTYPELEAFVTQELAQPRFRAGQIWQWLWRKNVADIDAMTDISLTTRELLKTTTTVFLPEIVTEQVSADGTRKLLLKLSDGEMVETVLIPGETRDGVTRWSQCLSCQVGCVMGCTFCSTGTMGFSRNMTAGEILAQVLVGKRVLQDDNPNRPLIRNLVFMGMGEPLLNLNEILRSLEILNDPKGLSFSPRRITVSTCGIQQGLKQLGDSGRAFIAVSLHAPAQELRARIMPKAAHWQLNDLVAALEAYPLKTREIITLEYMLLGGVNDHPEHARALGLIAKRLNAKLNLIVYNPVPGLPYYAPTAATVEAFQKILWDMDLTAILRKSKGQDIDAACGQLRAGSPLRPDAG